MINNNYHNNSITRVDLNLKTEQIYIFILLKRSISKYLNQTYYNVRSIFFFFFLNQNDTSRLNSGRFKLSISYELSHVNTDGIIQKNYSYKT